MTGPTIQQIKQTTPETLWQLLAALPGSMEAQILYGLLIAGAVGMIGHYLIRWLNGDIAGSLVKYLFIDYPRRTLLAYSGVAGAALGAIASNVFETDTHEFVGWLNVLWIGLTNGYAADSLANKGKSANGSNGNPAMVSIQPGGRVTAGPGASILAALALGAVLALGFAGDARAQAGNLQSTILASAARPAAPVTSAAQNNLPCSGAHVTLNLPAF